MAAASSQESLEKHWREFRPKSYWGTHGGLAALHGKLAAHHSILAGSLEPRTYDMGGNLIEMFVRHGWGPCDKHACLVMARYSCIVTVFLFSSGGAQHKNENPILRIL